VYVAVGDVNRDGTLDIITGPDAGGGPHVRVFSGRGGAVVRDFLAYSAAFRGGVRVAADDVNGDGFADVVTAAGPGGGPHVQVFSGADLRVLRSFLAYGADFTGGVYVAAGDIDSDGRADVITGPGRGGVPQVRVFSGATGGVLVSFLAYASDVRGGVRVAALDFDGDGASDVVTGAGPGGGPHVNVFVYPELLSGFEPLSARFALFAYDGTGFPERTGVFVAGA
jgi:hypothetical protein